MQEHLHDHTQEHSHNHAHDHSHAHSHDHAHDHSHEPAAASREELLALLSYMVSHNKHHAEELTELAKSVDGEAAEALHKAISLFDEGNEELSRALELMQKDAPERSE